MRKLCIFPEAKHPFEGYPQLVPWSMPERRLRVKEATFEMPEGFQPLNPEAYCKRFRHLLSADDLSASIRPSADQEVPAVPS